MLIAFPDAFEIGLSNLGIRILHHIVNGRADSVAEMTFAPWPDAEAEMRRMGIPLFSIDRHTPAHEFDVIGFSPAVRAAVHERAHDARARRACRCARSSATSATRS